MFHPLLRFAAVVTALGATPLSAQPADPAAPPLDVGHVERTSVNLILLDAVVVDEQDRTVPGLTREDFEIVAGGQSVPVDTLDVACASEPMEDARATNHPDRRAAPPESPGSRKIVLAFDYLHLPSLSAVESLELAQKTFVAEGGPDDEWMVVALTGAPRIEQSWTRDRTRVRAALQRMEHDITLWNGNFSHLNETGFVAGLEVLLETLGEVPGSKALVLFSAMQDVPLDGEFRRLAAAAATGRCAIFPVDTRGLIPPGAG